MENGSTHYYANLVLIPFIFLKNVVDDNINALFYITCTLYTVLLLPIIIMSWNFFFSSV